MLVLSTIHVPVRSFDCGELRWCLHDYGWIVFLGTERELEEVLVPAWLAPIALEATRRGCNYINFDQDAEVADGFVSYPH